MAKPHKIYYMIHQGDETPVLYGIHLILDSGRALFDRVVENPKMNAHVTLSSCSVSQHGIVMEKKLLFSYDRKMGFVVDHSCMEILKGDDSALDLALLAKSLLATDEPISLDLSLDEDALRALQ